MRIGQALLQIRRAYGHKTAMAVCAWLRAFNAGKRRLLGSNAKTEKTRDQLGIRNMVLNLSPANESNCWDLCPHASPACRKLCLKTAGRNFMPAALVARLSRTVLFMTRRDEFLHTLYAEIHAASRTFACGGPRVAVRLNNLSDLPWERIAPWLFRSLPGVIFYDYTKSRERYTRFLDRLRTRKLDWREWPSNYHLTFSQDERPESVRFATDIVASDGTAAVVFAGPELPETYNGRPVVDGDEHDYRPIDPEGVYVGLRAKGAARKAETDFTV